MTVMNQKKPCRIEGRPVQSVLIVRPSAIGDVVMASPMLTVIRKACPGVRIGWLVEPHIVDVLKTNPCLDTLIPWPKSHWKKLARSGHWMSLLRDILVFVRELRSWRFDVALDVQGLLRSRLLAFASGAPVRIGFESKEPGRFLMSKVVSRGGHSDQMGSEYQHLMRVLGFDCGPFHPCLGVTEATVAATCEKMQAAGVGDRFMALAPFTTRPQKHWFEERWSELAVRIKALSGMPAVLLGGPGDADAAGRIAAASAGCAVNMAGKLSLAQSMAVVQRCSLLVGVDTGLTHMGPAFDRPTIALFGSTCPYLNTSRENTHVIYQARHCSPCKRSPTCDGRFDCMADISVAEVLDNARRLLERGS